MTRRALPLVLCLLAASCGGDAPPAPQPPPAEPAPAPEVDVDLAVLRTVGDLPPRETRFDVALDADGVLYVEGRPTDLAGLAAALQKLGEGTSAREALDLDAVLALDRTLPWKAAQIVMQECAAQGVVRLFFAVRHAGDDERGAIATFLPQDILAQAPASILPPKVAVRADPEGEPSDPRGLETVLHAMHTELRALVEIDATPGTPLDVVLQVVDAACVGGAGQLAFIGTPYSPEKTDLREVVRKHRAAGATAHLSTLGAPWPAPTGPAADVPRVTGAYAGFLHDAVSGGIPVEQVEIQEPDGR